MTTYRERRERRAEKLDEWAEKRRANQAALSEAARADEAATGIPFGQPILRGHHSQRRHERAIERIDQAMARSVDNSRKASDMASRADGIRDQLDNSIYSDDPDAIERLTEKLATLEAKREAMKKRNADYRREHKAELKTMSAYQRGQAVPHPSYELSNLGGVISNTKRRIAQITRERKTGPTDRIITARFDSSCEACGAKLTKGEAIRYNRSDGARCVECEEQAA